MHCPREWRTVRSIQLGALQNLLLGTYGQVSPQIRKIRSIKNLIDSRYIAQHSEHRIACSQGRVPINSAEHVGRSASLLPARDESHLIDDSQNVLRGKESTRRRERRCTSRSACARTYSCNAFERQRDSCLLGSQADCREVPTNGRPCPVKDWGAHR